MVLDNYFQDMALYIYRAFAGGITTSQGFTSDISLIL